MAHVVNEYKQLKAQSSELLTEVGESLISLVEAPAPDQEEAHAAIDQQIQSFFQAYYELRKRHEQEHLSVAVLALTKSGKSTLINSFLGDELLPVNNVPETARISRILYCPSAIDPEPKLELKQPKSPASCTSAASSASPFDLTRALSGASNSSDTPVEVLRGAQQIRKHLQQLNKDVRTREHQHKDEQVLNITAPLVVLDSLESGSADLSGIRLCLLDTPGPNEAGEEGLKYQVERLLDRVDAAIYLLDYTKLKTSEEAQVLERLKSINPCLVSRLCSRLFFAVNKMDQADEGCGLDDDETRQYVAEMVTQQLNCPNFKLHPDQVLLLSARNALLARLVLANRADTANMGRFSCISFGSFNARSSGGGSSRSPEVLRDAALYMLHGSGVPELEKRVLGFLFEAAAGVKLVATLDDMGRLLTEVSNVATSSRAALAATTAVLASSSDLLQAELDGTEAQFDGLLDATQELQVEVVDELRAHLGSLRTRLFQFICDSLDAEGLRQEQGPAADVEMGGGGSSNTEESSGYHNRHHRHRRQRGGCCRSRCHHHRHGGYRRGSSSDACSYEGFTDRGDGYLWADSGSGSGVVQGSSSSSRRGSAGDSSQAASGSGGNSSSAGGWRRLRERFLSLFGGLGGGAGASESKDEISSALMDLTEDIMAQIQSEVTEAWHVMEVATNARASRLITSLNSAIQSLSTKLEGTVSEALQVHLEPVTLRMAAPDACQFHADLTELIDKGIETEVARHVRSCERTDLVWERRGVCRWTQYYVQVPRRRRIIETYTATAYSLRPDAVCDHFMHMVNSAISNTERQLAAYVKEYVRRQVATARGKVKEYGDRYLESMSAALQTARQGAEARAAALAQVEAYCATLDSLRSRLTALQARAELLVPHNSASGCGVFEQVVEYSDESDSDEHTQRTDLAAQHMEVQQLEAPQQEGHPQQPEQDNHMLAGQQTVLAEDIEVVHMPVGDSLDAEQQMVQQAAEAANKPSSSSSAAAASDSIRLGDLITCEGPAGLQYNAMAAIANTAEAEAAEAAEGLHQDAVQLQQAVSDRLDEAKLEAIADISSMADIVAGADDCTGSAIADMPAVSGNGSGSDANSGSGSTRGMSRMGSDSSYSSGQLLTFDEIAEAQQAQAAATGRLLMVELPTAQDTEQADQQQQSEVIVTAGQPHHDSEGEGAAAIDGVAVAAEQQQQEVANDAAVVADSTASLPAPVGLAELVHPAAHTHIATAVVVEPAAPQPLQQSSTSGSSVMPTLATPTSVFSPNATPSVVSPVSRDSAGGSDAGSTVSFASGTATDKTAFSGMTAGTGFTLDSGATQGTGFSIVQERLADSVLSTSGLQLAEPGVMLGQPTVTDLPTLAPVSVVPAAAVATEQPATVDGQSASFAAEGSNSGLGATAPTSSSLASTAAAAEQSQVAPPDASMYASIIAHSEDLEQHGSPGSAFDFRESFAAALSAAGLDGLVGPTPPSASAENSEDWQMVDAEDGEHSPGC